LYEPGQVRFGLMNRNRLHAVNLVR
jgi:hypothetical protein